MKSIIHNSLLVFIGMALLFSSSVRAEPITALITLLVAEKLTSSSEEQKEAAPRERPVADWREHLEENELAALEAIRQHPAIGACMEKADQDHPVASYHARKMARFSASVQQHLDHTGTLPDIKSLHYKWPAKAFRWCGEQAGIVTASSSTSLLTYAYNMARVVHFHHNHTGMVALNQ